MMLFLMAAGLTLIFGVMGLINLAHGSLYMVGAFAAACGGGATGSFLLALQPPWLRPRRPGALIELVVIRRLYDRDHLDQVLATFALILIFSEATRWVFGSFPLYLDIPDALSGPVTLPGGIEYPRYRLALIGAGAGGRAGLDLADREDAAWHPHPRGRERPRDDRALGVNISRLYTIVFALGAALAGLAGALVGAIQSVQVGMGEPVLILAFVVIVIGGIGSIRGALVGALLVGLTDTLGGIFLPELFKLFMTPAVATATGGALASMAIYILMAAVLIWRPDRALRGARMIPERAFNLALLAGLIAVPALGALGGRALYHHAGDPGGDPRAGRVGLNIALGFGGLVSLGHARSSGSAAMPWASSPITPRPTRR
jgi:branched-chain amino acid transport system permease protein